MPKVLTQAQVDAFERDGCLSPVRAMSAERAPPLPPRSSTRSKRASPTSRR